MGILRKATLGSLSMLLQETPQKCLVSSAAEADAVLGMLTVYSLTGNARAAAALGTLSRVTMGRFSMTLSVKPKH